MNFVECLETRRLFSTVTQGFPGFYEVTGTNTTDTISISVDQYASTFTLDGVTYGGVSYISIYGMGGDDTLAVFGAGAGSIGASIIAGDGVDDCTLSGLGGAVWGGEGNDMIRITDSFRGEAYGEGGNDYVLLSGTCADALVQGGDGNDILNALHGSVGVVMFGGAGNDRLYGGRGDDQLYAGPGADFLSGGPGNDEFHTQDGEGDTILGGDGFDTLFGDEAESFITAVENIVTPS